MNVSTGTVYGISDPRDGEVRYIGQTRKPLPERLKAHLSSSSRVGYWAASLVREGVRPAITPLVRDIPHGDLLGTERAQIERHCRSGLLLNVEGNPFVGFRAWLRDIGARGSVQDDADLYRRHLDHLEASGDLLPEFYALHVEAKQSGRWYAPGHAIFDSIPYTDEAIERQWDAAFDNSPCHAAVKGLPENFGQTVEEGEK